ncbi:DUF3817 domain-containing protein [Agrococcus jejuensis]|uniref:Integral membrane protein n=1 Tax=Agrococcus jejuensis TaxID=399736 RepID=A0A1G8GEB3_9MICO|nr:DUF3817 domain-containing protein [Agrococcus jejuensis]SDH92676.1 integral membrane protein [Agrococcus jejuensis]
MTAAAPTASRSPLSTPLALFRVVAIAEAITWALLIGGMILRAVTGEGIGVSIGGGVHGFVFLAYVATVVLVGIHQRWAAGTWALSIGSAIVPFATIPAELWLSRSGRLAGTWRLEATSDPRDQRPLDRAVRTLLRHPIAFGLAAAALVVVVFVALLVVGPPGGGEH